MITFKSEDGVWDIRIFLSWWKVLILIAVFVAVAAVAGWMM